jgi:cellulase/cellobiase CelA1
LIELWRTAPYLHDGSAATVTDAITTHNREDRRGNTSQAKCQGMGVGGMTADGGRLEWIKRAGSSKRDG